MKHEERGEEIYRLRQQVAALQQQQDAVSGDQAKAIIKLIQENRYLKQLLMMIKHTKGIEDLKWTSENWDAYAQLPGIPGEK